MKKQWWDSTITNSQSSDMYLKSQSCDMYIGTSQWSDIYNTEQSVKWLCIITEIKQAPPITLPCFMLPRWLEFHDQSYWSTVLRGITGFYPKMLMAEKDYGATRAVPHLWCHASCAELVVPPKENLNKGDQPREKIYEWQTEINRNSKIKYSHTSLVLVFNAEGVFCLKFNISRLFSK